MTMLCPRHALALNEQGRCPTCNWSPDKQGKARKKRKDDDGKDHGDGQCKHYLPSMRCPFPAAFDNWWCRFHQDPIHRIAGVTQAEFEREHAATRESRRVTFRQWYPSHGWQEREVQKRIDAHPEWQRQPHETHSQYGQRMSTLCGKLARGAVKAMPNPEPEDESMPMGQCVECGVSGPGPDFLCRPCALEAEMARR